jgi:hypothetical protein
MVEPGGEADLTKKSLRPQRDCQLGMQDLHRHPTVVPQVAPEEHHGHAAASELALEHVPLSQRGHEGVRGRRVQGEAFFGGSISNLLAEALRRY